MAITSDGFITKTSDELETKVQKILDNRERIRPRTNEEYGIRTDIVFHKEIWKKCHLGIELTDEEFDILEVENNELQAIDDDFVKYENYDDDPRSTIDQDLDLGLWQCYPHIKSNFTQHFKIDKTQTFPNFEHPDDIDPFKAYYDIPDGQEKMIKLDEMLMRARARYWGLTLDEINALEDTDIRRFSFPKLTENPDDMGYDRTYMNIPKPPEGVIYPKGQNHILVWTNYDKELLNKMMYELNHLPKMPSLNFDDWKFCPKGRDLKTRDIYNRRIPDRTPQAIIDAVLFKYPFQDGNWFADAYYPSTEESAYYGYLGKNYVKTAFEIEYGKRASIVSTEIKQDKQYIYDLCDEYKIEGQEFDWDKDQIEKIIIAYERGLIRDCSYDNAMDFIKFRQHEFLSEDEKRHNHILELKKQQDYEIWFADFQRRLDIKMRNLEVQQEREAEIEKERVRRIYEIEDEEDRMTEYCSTPITLARIKEIEQELEKEKEMKKVVDFDNINLDDIIEPEVEELSGTDKLVFPEEGLSIEEIVKNIDVSMLTGKYTPKEIEELKEFRETTAKQRELIEFQKTLDDDTPDNIMKLKQQRELENSNNSDIVIDVKENNEINENSGYSLLTENVDNQENISTNIIKGDLNNMDTKNNIIENDNSSQKLENEKLTGNVSDEIMDKMPENKSQYSLYDFDEIEKTELEFANKWLDLEDELREIKERMKALKKEYSERSINPTSVIKTLKRLEKRNKMSADQLQEEARVYSHLSKQNTILLRFTDRLTPKQRAKLDGNDNSPAGIMVHNENKNKHRQRELWELLNDETRNYEIST